MFAKIIRLSPHHNALASLVPNVRQHNGRSESRADRQRDDPFCLGTMWGLEKVDTLIEKTAVSVLEQNMFLATVQLFL